MRKGLRAMAFFVVFAWSGAGMVNMFLSCLVPFPDTLARKSRVFLWPLLVCTCGHFRTAGPSSPRPVYVNS